MLFYEVRDVFFVRIVDLKYRSQVSVRFDNNIVVSFKSRAGNKSEIIYVNRKYKMFRKIVSRTIAKCLLFSLQNREVICCLMGITYTGLSAQQCVNNTPTCSMLGKMQ